VERSHGTYQDRLVKELRLAQINTIAAANDLLANGYGEELSEKFAVAPRSAADYHRSHKGYDLAAIFCLEEERTALTDWTVRFENQFFQLEPPHKNMRPPGKVLVQRYLDGSLHFRYQQRELAYTVLPEKIRSLGLWGAEFRAINPVRTFIDDICCGQY
jgi:hypothetical protein